MKNKTLIKFRRAYFMILVLVLTYGCERDLSDDASAAKFPTVGEIFTDNFVSMGTNFYFPFLGSKLDAFSVDTQEGYESSASYRVDVPNADDPTGNYAGAILRVDGTGRDLSGYDALTFWAKASRGVSLDAIGFGQDFLDNKYQVNANNFSIGTNWAKYTIPIPDASKLTEERGVFWYAAGTQATGGSGYIVWFDDIKFEKTGTVAQPRPAIQNGQDAVVDSFTGVSLAVTGLIETFNLASGIDKTVAPAPSYYIFTSSNPSIASVDALGNVTVNGQGVAVITATLGGLEASGSLTINSLGDFELAPIPTRDPSKVTSIYSDVYQNVPVDFFNGFWQPFQTTLSADFVVNGDNILNYTNFNFVGNQFSNPTVDATVKSKLHINMYIPGTIPPNLDFLISLVDFGPNQVDGGGDDSRQQVFFNGSDFVANSWSTLEIPITLANRNNMGLIIYENINGSTLSNFYLDNIYFYDDSVPTGPTTAAPTPTVPAANAISVFSDAYNDVANDGLNNFNSGSVLAVESIGSNQVLKYSNLNFTGLEFLGPNVINASTATTLHLDVWSPDANEFKIKLVDFGPNGAFGGGDDTEFEINFGPTATNQWISYNIPLSNFTGLASRSHLAQIIFVNAPAGTLFIDNIYFFN